MSENESNKKQKMAEFTQDGPEAQRIAAVIPYYPFHGKTVRLP